MLGWPEFLSVGALVALASLWLTWRRDRKAERATYPLIEIYVAPYAIESTVHAMLLNITIGGTIISI